MLEPWNEHRGPGGISIPVTELEGSQPGPTWLLAGAVHGDEYEGPEAIRRIVAELNGRDFPGSVIAMPITNPMAYAAGTRCSPEDGGNLNRVFPGKMDGTLTEQWGHWIWQSFAERADRMVDLHSGGTTLKIETMAGFWHDDDASLAGIFPFVPWRISDLPGVFSCEFRRRRGPAIGLELGYGGNRQESSVRLVHESIIRLVHGETAVVRGPIYQSTNIDANCDGEWNTACDLRDSVTEGQLLGTVTDWSGRELELIRSPAKGRVLAIRNLVSVRKGELVAVHGRKVLS